MFKEDSLQSAVRILSLSASMVILPRVAIVSGQRFYFSGGTSSEQTYDFSTGYMVDVDGGFIVSWNIPRLEIDSEMQQLVRVVFKQRLSFTDEEFEKIGFSVIRASQPESSQLKLEGYEIYLVACFCNKDGLLGIVAISEEGEVIASYSSKDSDP